MTEQHPHPLRQFLPCRRFIPDQFPATPDNVPENSYLIVLDNRENSIFNNSFRDNVAGGGGVLFKEKLSELEIVTAELSEAGGFLGGCCPLEIVPGRGQGVVRESRWEVRTA